MDGTVEPQGLCRDGAVASVCKAPYTGREIKDHGILYSTSRAIRIGRLVLEARSRHEDAIAALLAAEHGVTLFKGKIEDVDRRTTEGFLRGAARIAGVDDCRGSILDLDFQNEFAAAWRDGEVVATTPDIICAMNSDSSEALGTEMLRYGQRVTVIALPAPELFLTPRGLETVGPRAFGYDFDYRAAV